MRLRWQRRRRRRQAAAALPRSRRHLRGGATMNRSALRRMRQPPRQIRRRRLLLLFFPVCAPSCNSKGPWTIHKKYSAETQMLFRPFRIVRHSHSPQAVQHGQRGRARTNPNVHACVRALTPLPLPSRLRDRDERAEHPCREQPDAREAAQADPDEVDRLDAQVGERAHELAQEHRQLRVDHAARDAELVVQINLRPVPLVIRVWTTAERAGGAAVGSASAY